MNHTQSPVHALGEDAGRSIAARLGCSLAAGVTILGVAYASGFAWQAATGGVNPRALSTGAQTIVAVATLILAQLVLGLTVCIDRCLRPERRIYSSIAVVFAACFTVTVSINRFVQVGVVRPAQLSGDTDQLRRFLPYDSGSAMFAMEILGWGVFLSLALLGLAAAFRGSRLDTALRWACITYAALGLAGAAGYAMRNAWFYLGFASWAVVLYVWTALLTSWFWRSWSGPQAGRASRQTNV